MAAIAAWRSVIGVSKEREAVAKEREADERRRADEHLKTIDALIVEWSQAFRRDRGHAFVVQMALGHELQVMTTLEGPLPKCLALANTDHGTIKPDDVPPLPRRR